MGIVFQFAADDKVIGKADEEAFAFQPGLYLLDEPVIEHPVQKDIREYGRDDAALGCTLFGVSQFSTLIAGRATQSYVRITSLPDSPSSP